MPLTDADQQILLQLAKNSIRHGLESGEMLELNAEDFEGSLQQPRASFVTLRINAALRGCMGSLEATVALAADVTQNAFKSAFKDPRFPPLTSAEVVSLHMDIAVLTSAEPIECDSEKELVQQLRPGVDGVTLMEGTQRSTLIPAAWSHFTSNKQLVQQLKIKAGLPVDYWSETIRFERYQAESFGE